MLDAVVGYSIFIFVIFNFDPLKSGGSTALPAPIVVMPLVSLPIYNACSTAPLFRAWELILSSPMILLLLQCLIHPLCPSFHLLCSPSSSSSSTSFRAWAYFESGPILWYYILWTTLFPSLLSSLFPLLPSHSFPPSFSLHSLRPPFLISSPFSLLPPSPLG